MLFEMNLHDEPYKMIKSGSKTIEMRLNDERRKDLKIGDQIRFTNRTTNETMIVNIINLFYYKNFTELYKHFDKISIGYKEDEIPNPSDMDLYYTKEQQAKYGVVAIEIEVVRK